MNTSCVSHAYTVFFLLTDDYLDLGKRFCHTHGYSERQSYPFAAALRVLETWKNDVLRKLDEDGIAEEELTEEMLWMDVAWPSFCDRALHLFESRTFQKTLPKVIEGGYARQRYIKRNRKHPLLNEDGQMLVYRTYAEACDDDLHPGEIIHQVYFESNRVNTAIATLLPPSPPAGDDASPPDATHTKRKGDNEQGGNHVESPFRSTVTARGGNPDTAGFSRGTIPHPSHFCEGDTLPFSHTHGAQKCEGESQEQRDMLRKSARGVRKNARHPVQKDEAPLRKNASNKNLNKNQEESQQESITSAAGAVGLFSHFDFFRVYDRQAILDLATLILPLKDTYKSAARAQAALLATEKAAEDLTANAFLRERGLPHLARLLCYFTDPTSPCKWRAYLHKRNAGLQVRLWHLTEQVVRLASREMEACDWWPPALLPAPGSAPASDTSVIDMAEIDGVAPEAVRGMDGEEVKDLVAYIRSLLPLQEFESVYVDYGTVNRWQQDRGYFIEFWYAEGQMLRLYSHADWERVTSCANYLGHPDFASHLLQAQYKPVAV